MRKSCKGSLMGTDLKLVIHQVETCTTGQQVCPQDKEGRKEMFYLTMHSTHFIYGYMASDIW